MHDSGVRTVLDLVGTPLVALLIAVIVAMFPLGRGAGMDRRALAASVEQALPLSRASCSSSWPSSRCSW